MLKVTPFNQLEGYPDNPGLYLKAARIPGGSSERWGHRTAKPAIEVITGPATVNEDRVLHGRSPSASAREAYREIIEAGLERGRNAMAIWQDLATEHGFPARGTAGAYRVSASRAVSVHKVTQGLKISGAINIHGEGRPVVIDVGVFLAP